MTYDIGKKLKSLRTAHNLTQEQLANQLGVSFQAISKWETNAAVPDISMFPVLANFYHVTTDELLGVNIRKTDERIRQLCDEVYRLEREWKAAEAVEKARESCKEYPGSEELKFALAHALERATYMIRTKEENLTEIAEILQNILETSTDTTMYTSYQSMLARTYHKLGDKEKVLEIVNGLPELSQTRPYQIIHMGLKDGAERADFVKDAIRMYYNYICTGIFSLCGIWPYKERDILPPLEQINLLDSFLKLQTIIFGENLMAENMTAGMCAYTKAALWCRLGNKENALSELEAAFAFAERFQNYDESGHYDSAMQNGLETLPRSAWSNSAYVDLYNELLDKTCKEKYAFLQNDPRFDAIVQKVSEKAGK